MRSCHLPQPLVALAMPHFWDHKSSSHSDSTSLLAPRFPTYTQAPFRAVSLTILDPGHSGCNGGE